MVKMQKCGATSIYPKEGCGQIGGAFDLPVQNVSFHITRVTELDVEESLELSHDLGKGCNCSIWESDGRIQIQSHENFREAYSLEAPM